MIIQTGRMEPTPAQRRMIQEHGDDQFMGRLPSDFGMAPMFDGWTHGVAYQMRPTGGSQ